MPLLDWGIHLRDSFRLCRVIQIYKICISIPDLICLLFSTVGESFFNKDNADGQQARQICAEAAMEDLKKFLGAGRYDGGRWIEVGEKAGEGVYMWRRRKGI